MTYDPLECLFKAHVRNIHSDRPGHFTDEIAAVHVLRTGNHEDILMARGEVADGGCLTRPGRSDGPGDVLVFLGIGQQHRKFLVDHCRRELPVFAPLSGNLGAELGEHIIADRLIAAVENRR